MYNYNLNNRLNNLNRNLNRLNNQYTNSVKKFNNIDTSLNDLKKQIEESIKRKNEQKNNKPNEIIIEDNPVGNVTPMGNVEEIDEILEFLKERAPQYYPTLKSSIVQNFRKSINDLYDLNTDYYIRDNKKDSNMNNFKLAEEVVNSNRDKVINYVAAILDPEYNFNAGIQVKQPNLMNPPSVSISIRTLKTIESDNFSSICVSWNPTIFSTPKTLNRIQIGIVGEKKEPLFANKVCSVLYSLGKLDGNVLTIEPSAWNAPVYGINDNIPDIGISKARLVSSKIKISFRGAVLQQGGTIMGCATFQGPPGVIAATEKSEDVRLYGASGNQLTWGQLFKVSNPELNLLTDHSPFGEKIISNGIWSKNVNIVNDANGISAIYIPTDPMDQIFYTPSTYYGEKISTPNKECKTFNNTVCLSSDKGAHLNYLFNIQGIPAGNTNPITIETYTTWEVIPTNESASSLRNSNSTNNLSKEDVLKVQNTLDSYFDNHTGLHTNKVNQKMGGLLGIVTDIVDATNNVLKNLNNKYKN